MTNFDMFAESVNLTQGDSFTDSGCVDHYLNCEVTDLQQTFNEGFLYTDNALCKITADDDSSEQTFDGTSDMFSDQFMSNSALPMDIQESVAETIVSLSQGLTPASCGSLSGIWDEMVQKIIILEYDLKGCKSEFIKDSVLGERLKELITGMESFSISLNLLLDQTVLHPVELLLLYNMARECELRKCQLKLYEREFSSVLNGIASKETELVILDQPFPSSIKAKAPMGNLSVRLLIGTMSDIDISQLKGTEVKIEILCESGKVTCSNGSKKWSRQVISKLDETGSLILTNMQLSSSSSKIVNLRISVPLHDNCKVVTEAFVVNSNGNQWACAEGLLMEDLLFECNKEISRTRFCNLLQRWYILATGQEFVANCKLLTKEDFDYFFETKFSSQPNLTRAEFKTFWSWFGPIMSQVKFRFKMISMWLDGAIAGFMKRSKAEQILFSELEGTFLIRVSSEVHVKGFTGIIFSFRDVDHENKPLVKHYLVKENDILANRKSLADFAREQERLITLLSVNTDLATQKRVLVRSGKNTAFRIHYNLAYEIPPTPPGYVASI